MFELTSLISQLLERFLLMIFSLKEAYLLISFDRLKLACF